MTELIAAHLFCCTPGNKEEIQKYLKARDFFVFSISIGETV